MTLRSLANYLIVIMFFWAITGDLHGQIPTHWYLNKDNKLSTNTIYQIIQDNDGAIWMGTSSDLIKYNSLDLSSFSNSALGDNEFFTVVLDSMNRVWGINVSNQLTYIENNELHIIELLNPSALIRNINIYFNQQFLFLITNFYSTSHGSPNSISSNLYKIPLNEISNTINLKKYLIKNYYTEILQIFELDKKLVLLSGDSQGKYSLIHYIQDTLTIPIPQKIKTHLKERDSYSKLHYKDLKDGVHTLFGGNKVLLWTDNGLTHNILIKKTINAVGKVKDKIWLLTTEGIYFVNLNDGKVSSSPIFKNHTFSNFFQDKEENIWLATLDKGVLIIPSIDFQSFSPQQSPFFSFLTLEKTSFLCGGRNQLILFEKNKLPVDLIIPPNVGRILDIHKKGNLVIFASDNGLYQSDDFKNIPFLYIKDSKASKAIFIKDEKQELWQGRYNVLVLFKKEATNWIQQKTVIKNKTLAIEEDNQGYIWAGTISNLYQIRDANNIFRLGKDSTSYFVKDIKSGIDSTLFVATCNSGILKVNTYSHIIDTLILPYQDCFNTLFYDEGILWIGGNKGIIHYNTKDKTTHQISVYDGLPSNEINAFIRLEDSILVASSKGLIKFPKNIVPYLKRPANIAIKRIIIDKDTISPNHSLLHLKYFQNNIRIEFEAINFYLRGTTAFKYRLSASEDWQTSKQAFIVLTNLKSGNYQFEVSLDNNIPMASLPKFSFTIDKPWWEKLWIILLIAFVIIGSIIWFFIAHQKKILADKAMQALISELKMTALQAQMNPHFIFNCLNTIQSFIFKKETLSASASLGMFSKLIRNVFEYSAEKRLSLEKEIDFLQLYINLEQLRFDENLEVKVELSDFVSNNLFALSVPPLLIQPIIENAFAHGLLHSSGHKKLSIQFEMEGDYLKCTVCDNGVGREYSTTLNEWEIKGKKSSGLKLTEKRLETFNNQTKSNNKLKKCFIITDLKDKVNGMANGTKVEMFIKTH